MILAEAIQLDLTTLIAAVTALAAGGAGGHFNARRRGSSSSSSGASWEKSIRREERLDASIKETVRQVKDLSTLVAQLRKKVHDNGQSLTQLTLRMDLVDGGKPGGGANTGPIQVGSPA